MSTAERLREKGREEGRAEGRQEGLTEGLSRSLLKRLSFRFGPEAVAKIRERVQHASVTELERWDDRLYSASTLDDVFDDN